MTSGSSDITSSHSWALLLFWRAKVKLKLVNIQHPTAKQSTSPQKRSCFQFQILFYNKTAIFHFSENTSKRLGCKKWDFEVEGKNRPTNKQIYITGNFEQTNAGNLEQTNMGILNKQIWLNGNDLTGNFNLTNSSMVEQDIVLWGGRDTVL